MGLHLQSRGIAVLNDKCLNCKHWAQLQSRWDKGLCEANNEGNVTDLAHTCQYIERADK